jgi:hypothetical protein
MLHLSVLLYNFLHANLYIVPRTGVADTCQTHYVWCDCPQDRAGTDVQTHRKATKAPLTGNRSTKPPPAGTSQTSTICTRCAVALLCECLQFRHTACKRPGRLRGHPVVPLEPPPLGSLRGPASRGQYTDCGERPAAGTRRQPQCTVGVQARSPSVGIQGHPKVPE